MNPSQVNLAELKTVEDCLNAIHDIAHDWKNAKGGFDAWERAWDEGYAVELTLAAQSKIAAINAKMDKIEPESAP